MTLPLCHQLHQQNIRRLEFMPVFFNLFNEAEPFVAILIDHGIHVFFVGLLCPKGQNEPPPHQLGGL